MLAFAVLRQIACIIMLQEILIYFLLWSILTGRQDVYSFDYNVNSINIDPLVPCYTLIKTQKEGYTYTRYNLSQIKSGQNKVICIEYNDGNIIIVVQIYGPYH